MQPALAEAKQVVGQELMASVNKAAKTGPTELKQLCMQMAGNTAPFTPPPPGLTPSMGACQDRECEGRCYPPTSPPR